MLQTWQPHLLTSWGDTLGSLRTAETTTWSSCRSTRLSSKVRKRLFQSARQGNVIFNPPIPWSTTGVLGVLGVPVGVGGKCCW